MVKLFTTDAHMAYVKLPSVTDAMLTLMRLHNYRLNGRFLRVSFSSKDAQSFDSSSSGGGHAHQQSHQSQAASAFSGDGQPLKVEQEYQQDDGMGADE